MVPAPGSVMVRLVAGPEVFVADRLKLLRSPEVTRSRQTLLAVTSTPVAGGWNWPVVVLAVPSFSSVAGPIGSPYRSTELSEVVPFGKSVSG